MSVKNAMIGFILNLLASGVWQYFSDKKVNPIIVGSAIIWVLLLLDSGRKDPTDSFLTKLWQKLVPRKTVKFIPDMKYGCEGSWNNGGINGEPAMQVRGQWYATNLTNENVRILRAYLVSPRTEIIVSTQAPDSKMFGEFPILPRCTTEVFVHFWVQPPIRKEGESFIGQIIFIDQFNNKHKVKVTFESRHREGKLVLSVRSIRKYQDELNRKLLPKALTKKLKRKGELLSHNFKISVQDARWEIKDLEKPDWIYTLKIEGNKLNLYKRFIPPPRQKPAVAPYKWTKV